MPRFLFMLWAYAHLIPAALVERFTVRQHEVGLLGFHAVMLKSEDWSAKPIAVICKCW